MSEDDKRWHQDQKTYGWSLPPKAAWPLRLPLIRHIRALWLTTLAEQHAAAWGSIGIGIGGPNPYDRWVLYAIARGWC